MRKSPSTTLRCEVSQKCSRSNERYLGVLLEGQIGICMRYKSVLRLDSYQQNGILKKSGKDGYTKQLVFSSDLKPTVQLTLT
jgi:hypothetical protein